MTPESLFAIANTSVLPAWLLLLVAPRWRWTHRLVPTALAIPLALLYGYLLAAHWGESQGGFSTLREVASLFGNDWVLLGGWVHYLVFDLFVGSWIVRDAQRLQIPHLAVAPAVILSFLLGPLGLLVYWLLRLALRRRIILNEPEHALSLRTPAQ